MKREIEIWNTLKNKTSHLTYADFHRVEVWNKAGFPDINGCYKGVEIWIESKSALQSGKVKFQKMQIPWMDRRRRSGGNVYLAVVEYQTDSLYIYDGADSLDVDEHGIYDIPPLFITKEPWDWIEILEQITRSPLHVLGG